INPQLLAEKDRREVEAMEEERRHQLSASIEAKSGRYRAEKAAKQLAEAKESDAILARSDLSDLSEEEGERVVTEGFAILSKDAGLVEFGSQPTELGINGPAAGEPANAYYEQAPRGGAVVADSPARFEDDFDHDGARDHAWA